MTNSMANTHPTGVALCLMFCADALDELGPYVSLRCCFEYGVAIRGSWQLGLSFLRH
jgi:hypothetical protein